MLQGNYSNDGWRGALGLENLTANVECRRRIIQAGAIPPLKHLVKCESEEEKAHATGTLIDLTRERDARNLVSEQDRISALVDLVQCGTVRQQDNAVHVLQNLSVSDVNEVAIAQAGAIPPLIRLVTGGNALQKEKAAATLMNLAHNDDNKRAIVEAGGVPCLVALLRDGNQAQQENAMVALWYLIVVDKVRIPLKIVKGDTIPLYAKLMETGSRRDLAEATMGVFSVACVRKDAVQLEDIPALTKLICGEFRSARAHAAAALANVAFDATPPIISAILASNGVAQLVELLRIGSQGRERENSIAALMNLATYVHMKTAIADAGGYAALCELAVGGTEREQDLASYSLKNFYAPRWAFKAVVSRTSYSILKEDHGKLRQFR